MAPGSIVGAGVPVDTVVARTMIVPVILRLEEGPDPVAEGAGSPRGRMGA